MFRMVRLKCERVQLIRSRRLIYLLRVSDAYVWGKYVMIGLHKGLSVGRRQA